MVTSVDGAPGSVEGFTVRTDAGTTLQLKVRTLDVSSGLPAAHLRDHLLSGEPIVVEYRVENGVSVAVRFNDAAGGSRTGD